MRHYRRPRAKPGQLKAQWGKIDHEGEDICYAWGGDGASKNAAHFIHNIFSEHLYNELEKRGYDLKTFRFSIQQLNESKESTNSPNGKP